MLVSFVRFFKLFGQNHVIIPSIAKRIVWLLLGKYLLFQTTDHVFLKWHSAMSRWQTQLITWNWATTLSKLQKVCKRSQGNAWWFPLYYSWSSPSLSYSLFWNHGVSDPKRKVVYILRRQKYKLIFHIYLFVYILSAWKLFSCWLVAVTLIPLLPLSQI